MVCMKKETELYSYVVLVVPNHFHVARDRDTEYTISRDKITITLFNIQYIHSAFNISKNMHTAN